MPVARADASEIAVIGPDVSRFPKYFRQLSAARPPRLAALAERDPKRLIPPLHGALLKNEQDVHLFERLAFLQRREAGRPGG